MTARACILRIEGTNCEEETRRALIQAGAKAELVHLKQLECSRDVPKVKWRSLFDYEILLLPGGFSAGDSVRAGAILAARIKSILEKDLRLFVEGGRLVGGICNGFQVLVELGLLPAFDTVISERPEAALFTNANARFECRPVLLKNENRGKCIWTRDVPEMAGLFPVAHGEGRFVAPPGKENDYIERLLENDQLVFRYVKDDGSPAKGEYPYNPNGSLYDIAGICNREGNVMGMMPHPERVCDPLLNPDWTRMKRPAAGLAVFSSAVKYVTGELEHKRENVLVVIHEASDATVANMLKSLLEAEDIPTVVLGDLGSVFDSLSPFRPRVAVPARFAEEARDIIAACIEQAEGSGA